MQRRQLEESEVIAVWPQSASGPWPAAEKVSKAAARTKGVRAGETVTPWQLNKIRQVEEEMGVTVNGEGQDERRE